MSGNFYDLDEKNDINNSERPDNVSERVIKLDVEDLNPRDRLQVADYTSEANKFVIERLKTMPDYISEDVSDGCVNYAFQNISFLFGRIDSGEGIHNVPDMYLKEKEEVEQKIDNMLDIYGKSKVDYPSGAYALSSYLYKQQMPTHPKAADRLAEILKSAEFVIDNILCDPKSDIDHVVIGEIAEKTSSMIRREKKQVKAEKTA